ncbi:MAG: energy-coupled thiamine transporter ThiT [Clostridia bacterium]|nr:energy-coupled thiamine transporter ThiT [Clostridia bacterium]
MNRRKTITVLVECAIMVALSVVLSFIRLFKLPLGGAVTLASRLPVCVASIRHGVKKGALASFVYSLFQLVFGITLDGLFGWGLTPAMLIGCMLFDDVIAFSVLCLAGLFRKKGEIGIYAGFTVAFAARFISHFISGYVIFKNLEQWELFGKVFENKPALYSISYNGLYMLPELVITLVIVVVLMRIPYVKKNILAPKD